MKIRVAAILLWLTLLSGAYSAFAAPAWSIDIREAGDPEAGDIIGCLELSCHGDVPLIVGGRPHIVHVEAFIDGTVVKLAFADRGTPPFALQYTQSKPLLVFVSGARLRASVPLTEPAEPAEPGVINPLYQWKPPLALLTIAIKLVNYHQKPLSDVWMSQHHAKPISQEQ